MHEGFVTHVAGERLLPGVSALANLRREGLREFLRANVADVTSDGGSSFARTHVYATCGVFPIKFFTANCTAAYLKLTADDRWTIVGP